MNQSTEQHKRLSHPGWYTSTLQLDISELPGTRSGECHISVPTNPVLDVAERTRCVSLLIDFGEERGVQALNESHGEGATSLKVSMTSDGRPALSWVASLRLRIRAMRSGSGSPATWTLTASSERSAAAVSRPMAWVARSI